MRAVRGRNCQLRKHSVDMNRVWADRARLVPAQIEPAIVDSSFDPDRDPGACRATAPNRAMNSDV
eukprot:3785415-Pyramimonas_sp.AAC.1